MSDAVVQTVDVPGHIFVYRATTAAAFGGGAKGAEEEEGADGNNNCYRLEAIRPTLRTVYCSATNLEFTSLADADLVQLQLFNELFVPECNAQALRFVFETDDAGAFLCAPTRQGTLRVLEHALPGETLPLDAGDVVERPFVDSAGDEVQTLSVVTLMHAFVETRTPGRFFHAGLSTLPSQALGVPVFLTPRKLQNLLGHWSHGLCTTAKRRSQYSVRFADGRTELRHTLQAERAKVIEATR